MEEESRNRWLGVVFSLCLLVLAASAAFLGWTMGKPDSELVAEAEYPAILSDFVLETLEGERVGPETLSGEVIVVDFWATWCRPCDVQTKLIEMVFEEYADRGVDFLAVSVGEDADTVREFIADKPYSYPVLIDPEGLMLDEGEVYMLPTVMVLDRERNVVFLRSGITGAPKLRELLDQMVSS